MEHTLEMQNIDKCFGPVQVLKAVNFSLEKGEVKALLGANGAGKSTLIKIMGGVHAQTNGEMRLKGQPVRFKNTAESRNSGISIIYQELSLIPTQTVLENLFLGREQTGRGGFLHKADMRKEYQRICQDFQFEIDPDIVVSKLSIAKQQMVEIMKAISCNAEIIIMDEPTTSLTNNEKEGLFRIIGQLRERGKSIIYISHILEEIFQICDSASIMRNGEMVGTYPIGELTKEKITQLMTGEVNRDIAGRKTHFSARYEEDPVLEVSQLTRGNVVRKVSFKVYPGEVVGLAGLVGPKRTEIVNMIFGLDRKTSGEIRVKGKPVDIKSPAHAIAHGIGLIPEDRKNLGLILGQEIYKNATAVQIDKFRVNRFLSKKKELEFAQAGVDQLGIKINSLTQKTRELSGGNQQKVVVSKWLGQDMDLVIYDEPTKGIDIAAKEDIFRTVEEFSRQGTGVIFISSDLEEVLRVADRILVIRDGEVAGELENKDITVQDIMNRIFNV